MNTIFDDDVANKKANLLLDEINQICDVLECVDDLMPSNSYEQKMKVSSSMREKFMEISDNSIQFLDDRIGRFKDEMTLLKALIGEFDTNYRNMADAIAIASCKILQFQIGKVSCFVKQKNFQLDKEEFDSNSDLLYNIKRLLYSISEFDTTDIGKNEIIKTDRTVITISKRLTPKSFISRVLGIFK